MEENDDYPQYCKFDGLNVEALNEEDRVGPCIQRLDKLEKIFEEHNPLSYTLFYEAKIEEAENYS